MADRDEEREDAADARRPVPRRPAAAAAAAAAAAPALADEMAVPVDWAPEPADVRFVIASVPEATKSIFASKMNLFYGTSVSMVVAVFLKALFKARIAQSPQQLIIDLIFSVFVSQTVSREWATIYNSLGAASILKTFEISGTRNSTDAKSAWVSGSKMNSTAIHALGQCVMECAAKTTSLGKKADSDGTIFMPKPGASEYHRLTNEAAKSVSEADKAALAHFRTHSATLMRAVENIMESGAGSVDEIAAKVAALAVKKF
jgi:hypothetical protein